jgi:hypothetical protein
LQVLSRKGFIKALGLRQVIEVRNIFFGVFALSHHNLGEPNVSQTDSCTVDAVDDLANLNEDFSDLIIKIDLNEVNSLVKAILLLQNNNSFRADLLKNFNERKKSIFDFDNKKKIIEKILLFKNKRDTWE